MSKKNAKKKKQMKRLKEMTEQELEDEMKFIHDHKIKLEVKLKDLEEDENFLEAKKVHEKLKDLNLLEGLYIEQKVKLQQKGEKDLLHDYLKDEESDFKEQWDKKNSQYKEKSEEIIASTIERQKKEEKEIYEHIKSNLMTKKIKYSRTILDMRKQIKLLVKKKQYVEAEKIQKRLKPIELQEIEKHHQVQEATLRSKMKIVRKRHRSELEALKQRILQGKEELRVQQELERKRLLRKHENMSTEVKNKQKKYYTGYKNAIKKQTQVMEEHYEKNVINFQTKFDKMGISNYSSPQFLSRIKKRGSAKKGTSPKKRKNKPKVK